MGASRFIGRVGGLAVALGVGAAVFSASGEAWAAPSDGAGPRGSDSAGAAGSPTSKSVTRRGSAGPARGPAVAGSDKRQRPVRPESSPASIAVPSAAEARRVAAPAVVDHESTPSGGVPAGEVTAVLSGSGDSVSDGAGTDPLVPADSPAEWALLAAARRQPLSAASGHAAAAQVTSSATVTEGGITVDPTVDLVDGIIQGTLQASSSRGLELKYAVVGGSGGGKIGLGTVPNSATTTDPQSYTILPYATWLDPGGSKGLETFRVRVSEVTEFNNFLISIPLAGLLAAPVIDLLQQLPLIGDLLAPIIGSSIVATIDVDVATLAAGMTPVAYTYDVVSFDGVKISTNFFPAAGIEAGDTAPTVLFGPGLGGAGATDPYGPTASSDFVPDVAVLRNADYNVVTWDPRGEYASGGQLQLDNPFFEGRDTSALVSWIAENPLADLDEPGDPKVGMVGGSYGGGIQLVTASTDPRIDAIVPGIAWNSLVESLYPNENFKSAWANFLLLALQVLPRTEGSTGSRINPLIYQAILTGNLFGRVGQTALAMVSSSGPTTLLNQLQAPTLLVQGTYDSLFPLEQAVANAQTILANPYDTPVKMIWFCGGHGVCGDKPVPPPEAQKAQIYADTIAWLDQYVAGRGNPADAIPDFQWYDQRNEYYSSELFSFQAGFNDPTPRSVTGDGGNLVILPLLGGSGSAGVPPAFDGTPLAVLYRFPFDAFLGITATPAPNSLTVPVPLDLGDQIVGAPELSFSYRGLGTSRAVFAQIVEGPSPDYPDGRVIGSIVTAVPVTLDGRTHTVSIPMQQIAYTKYDDTLSPPLTLQITSFATQFANSSFGVIDISDITLDLPIRAD